MLNEIGHGKLNTRATLEITALLKSAFLERIYNTYMFKLKQVSALLFCSAFITQSFASTFFFPDIDPIFTPRDAPEWLQNGRGNDGYISITSEVIPTSSCVSLSSKSLWGSEQTQLVISLTTNGFNNKLNDVEIPIATFDGRETGGECASLSTTPLKVVPFALTKAFSAENPGHLSIVANVKTASNTNQDVIGSVQLMLGAAAMVATGGAATAIGGITATVGNPVLSEAQARTNKLMKGMVNGKTPILLSWPDIRGGIETIEIPVYRAEGSLGRTPDQKIQQLQTDPEAEKTKLFEIRLSFSYTKTLFDQSASGVNDFPNREGISTSNVLNFPSLTGNENLLQVLNSTSPSLLQAIGPAEGRDLTNACSIGFEKLKSAGLNNLDMAIVMKSFIDEAKRGTDWYTNSNLVKSCFNQAPNVQSYLEKVYGQSQPKFIIGDVQDGVGKDYREWRDSIGPVLSNFRQALMAKNNRTNLLVAFNGGQDIELSFTPEVEPWVTPENTNSDPETSIDSKKTYPGISALANKKFNASGCFIYRDQVNLSPKNLGAYLILEDANNQFWLGNIKLNSDGKSKINRLKISSLNADWKDHFNSYHYPGGECAAILSKLK